MTRSDTAHYEGLTWWGPYDERGVGELLKLIEVPADGCALDVGCGDGTLLSRLAERFGLSVTGVDRSEAALAHARAAFASAQSPGTQDWRCQDADGLAFPPNRFDVIGWLGGPYVGGSHESTIDVFSRWLRSDGWLLLGLGFWIVPPPAPYLEATGLPADDLEDEAGMLAPLHAAGFEQRGARVEFSGCVGSFRGHTPGEP